MLVILRQLFRLMRTTGKRPFRFSAASSSAKGKNTNLKGSSWLCAKFC